MKLFYTDQFVLPLPEWHRFPMQKYSRLRQRVLEEGIVQSEDLLVPPPASEEQLLHVHDADYVHRVMERTLSPLEVRDLGFPWSPQLVERSRRSCGATIEAVRHSAIDGVSANLAGGTHHASRSRGAGYCVFNDVAVAARAAQVEGLARQVLILDCDVHQGDGTALIFLEDPSVFTFSIHGANNYPLQKPTSDLDLPLPDGTGDEEYLEALEHGMSLAMERFRPDLVIYLAGADPYIEDRFGRLGLSKAGLAERDRLVFRQCQASGLPLVVTMAGGYSKNLDDIVDIHLQTIRIAADHAGESRRL